MPTITWRVGLDPADPDSCRWLRCLVRPEDIARAEHLETALAVAATQWPTVHRGDAVSGLAGLLEEARGARPRGG